MTGELAIVLIGVLLLIGGCVAMWYAFSGRGTRGRRRLVGAMGCLVFCTLLAGIAAVVYPIFNSARYAARDVPCITNMNQIGKAILIYTGENDGRMPKSDWSDALGEYMDESYFACPRLKAPYGYTLNEAVIGIDTAKVDTGATVSAFDGPGGKNRIGEVSSMIFRHPGGTAVVGYLDGHSRRLKREEVGDRRSGSLDVGSTFIRLPVVGSPFGD